MEQHKQPLIVGAMIVGAVLIIVLALVFTRDNAEQTETATGNDVTENNETGGEKEEGSGSQQPETPETPENPETPEQPENPETGVLPSNWQELTGAQKVTLNPLGCDLETQIVYAEDGSCHDKSQPGGEPVPASPDRVILPAEPTKADFEALLEPYLTEKAKLVLQTRTVLEDGGTVISEGLCPPDRLFGSDCGSYYNSSEHMAYTFYDADDRDPHREFVTFIHEFVHALDYHDHYMGELDTTQHSATQINQGMLHLYNNPPADHNSGIRLAGTDKCLYTDYRYTLDLRGWELLYPLIPGKVLPGQNRAQRFPAELYAVLAVEVEPLTPFLKSITANSLLIGKLSLI